MDRLSDRLARRLIQAGLRPGDRVGIILPNIPQFILVFYAVLKAGGVVVAMNPQYKLRELEFQILNSEAKIIFCLQNLKELVEKIKDKAALETIVYTLEDNAAVLTLALDETALSEKSRDDWLLRWLSTHGNEQTLPLPVVSADDAAIFQYSGGTTGTPKAAIGLHRNLVANTTQFRNWLSGMQDGEEVVLTAIPLYHVYGMVIAMSVGIGLGASLVLIENGRDLDGILRNIQKYQATLFPGVPNLYQAINHHPDVLAGKVDLHSIKACISGSAPLLPEIKQEFETLTGGKLMEGYGLSEAPTATHCNPMFGTNKPGSIGLPLPGVDCKIVELEDGTREVPLGSPGELVLCGPQVMAGYHHLPEEEKSVLVDGWLHTGDVARMDEDGYFYLVDRKKELIKISGFQVWPREVEEVIALHPKVKEVAVSGVPDPIRVEIVAAWVVTKPGETLTAEEVRAWCRQYIAAYKVPTLVKFREEIPRTSVGKVLRRVLRNEYINGAGA